MTQEEEHKILITRIRGLNESYRRNMLQLFKEAGIPEEQFIEPTLPHLDTYFRVELILHEGCQDDKATHYISAGEVVRYYRVYQKGFGKAVVAGQKVEWYCKSLEEAQQSYDPKEVISVKIEPYMLMFPPDFKPVAIQ
ncbi:MAG: hypothetical protein ACTSPI_17865 [Candidatus Heimdallarchaeaceae archaeon]